MTVRGGGLYVVDTLTTPMAVTREYNKELIGPSGCGGLIGTGGDLVYINSGSATAATSTRSTPPPTRSSARWRPPRTGPMRTAWYWSAGATSGSRTGATATPSRLWIPYVRGRRQDRRRRGRARPDGAEPRWRSGVRHAARPRALTGGPTAIGTTPGVAIMFVENGGMNGRRVAFIPIGSQDEGSHADPHALAIRRLGALSREISPPDSVAWGLVPRRSPPERGRGTSPRATTRHLRCRMKREERTIMSSEYANQTRWSRPIGSPSTWTIRTSA